MLSVFLEIPWDHMYLGLKKVYNNSDKNKEIQIRHLEMIPVLNLSATAWLVDQHCNHSTLAVQQSWASIRHALANYFTLV